MWYKYLVGHKMQYFVIKERNPMHDGWPKNKRIKMGLWGVEFSIFYFSAL